MDVAARDADDLRIAFDDGAEAADVTEALTVDRRDADLKRRVVQEDEGRTAWRKRERLFEPGEPIGVKLSARPFRVG